MPALLVIACLQGVECIRFCVVEWVCRVRKLCRCSSFMAAGSESKGNADLCHVLELKDG